MKYKSIIFIIATSILAIAPLTNAIAQFANTDAGPQTGLPRSSLTIQTASGARQFQVELAATPSSREIGMMWRTQIGRTQGMLFSHRDNAPRAFWMKNTLIPLDIIYIRQNGTIARIARNAQPLNLAPIPSGEPVSAVLEIGGGEADRQNIREGNRVIHPIFHNVPTAQKHKKRR